MLTTDDLVQGNNCFFAATGITDGELLRGVQYHEFGATTQSLVMRSKSGTLRKIDASHALAKLAEFSSISFGSPRRPGDDAVYLNRFLGLPYSDAGLRSQTSSVGGTTG